jgi:phage shock protein A
MNPDDPKGNLARAQFEGTDLRVLDYLISEAEDNLESAQRAVDSFILDKSQNLANLEPATDAADSAMVLNEGDALYLKKLRSDVQRCSQKIEKLKTRRQNLINERSSPDRMQ